MEDCRDLILTRVRRTVEKILYCDLVKHAVNMSLRIKRYDPSRLTEGKIIFMFGKRNTGKSVLMTDIASKGPRFDFCIAFAPTLSTRVVLCQYIPSSCVYDEFSVDRLERVISVQQQLVSQGKKRSVLIIMDDCMYNKNVFTSTAMRNLFYNGRHLHLSLICCCQYALDLPSSVRTQIDLTFVLKESIKVNRTRLYKYFFGMFDKEAVFEKCFHLCTANYGALVMDNTVSSTKVEDTVFWYRADPNPPAFKLCREVYWKMNEACGISPEEARKAQARRFEIEAAAAMTARPAPKNGVVVVETEDENGCVVTSSG
jgi:hypothetical protein